MARPFDVVIGPPEDKAKRKTRLQKKWREKFHANLPMPYSDYLKAQKAKNKARWAEKVKRINDGANHGRDKRAEALRQVAKIKRIPFDKAQAEAEGTVTSELRNWVRKNKQKLKEPHRFVAEIKTVAQTVKFKKIDLRSDATNRRILNEQEERLKELQEYRNKPVWKPRKKA